MAPHSSTLAWKIPWMEEPGRLQSMGSLRLGHDRAPSLLLFTFMHWRRKWQPTSGFLPGESQRQRSLVGYCLWGHTESDTTEVTQQPQRQQSPSPVNILLQYITISQTYFTCCSVNVLFVVQDPLQRVHITFSCYTSLISSSLISQGFNTNQINVKTLCKMKRNIRI